MDEQEFFNKIKELQKQRDLLKKDVTVLECKINELRDILELKNIKKGYYTLLYSVSSMWCNLSILSFRRNRFDR